eukprot:4825960-Pleurochrysis_carterae.AAC.5
MQAEHPRYAHVVKLQGTEGEPLSDGEGGSRRRRNILKEGEKEVSTHSKFGETGICQGVNAARLPVREHMNKRCTGRSSWLGCCGNILRVAIVGALALCTQQRRQLGGAEASRTW